MDRIGGSAVLPRWRSERHLGRMHILANAGPALAAAVLALAAVRMLGPALGADPLWHGPIAAALYLGALMLRFRPLWRDLQRLAYAKAV